MKLHLHVKTEYFNAIKSGAKKEENRLANDYWKKRFVTVMKTGHILTREYESVVIYNAYKPGAENRVEFPWRRWTVKTITHPHFGPKPVTVFAIKLEAMP